MEDYLDLDAWERQCPREPSYSHVVEYVWQEPAVGSAKYNPDRRQGPVSADPTKPVLLGLLGDNREMQRDHKTRLYIAYSFIWLNSPCSCNILLNACDAMGSKSSVLIPCRSVHLTAVWHGFHIDAMPRQTLFCSFLFSYNFLCIIGTL